MHRLGVGYTEDLSFARITYYPEKNLLHSHLLGASEIDLEMATLIQETARKLTGNDRYRSLVTMEGNVSISSEGRAVGATEESTKNLIAQAIVVTGLATRLLGNFFIRFNKPASPTELFSTREQAIEWLLDFA